MDRDWFVSLFLCGSSGNWSLYSYNGRIIYYSYNGRIIFDSCNER